MLNWADSLQCANNLEVVKFCMIRQKLLVTAVVNLAHVPIGEMRSSLSRRQVAEVGERQHIVHGVPADTIELLKRFATDFGGTGHTRNDT